MKEFIRSLACAVCKALSPKVVEPPSPVVPIEPGPITDYIIMSRNDFIAKLAPLSVVPISLTTPLDSDLSITTKAELDILAPYLTFAADLYINEIVDCDDYGIEAQSKAAFKYHVSGIRMALGHMPLGYHAFALTIDNEGNIWLLEPNAGFPYTGQWFKIGDEKQYFPDKVLV